MDQKLIHVDVRRHHQASGTYDAQLVISQGSDAVRIWCPTVDAAVALRNQLVELARDHMTDPANIRSVLGVQGVYA